MREPRGLSPASHDRLRVVLVTFALVYLGTFIGLPVAVVFTHAVSEGMRAYMLALVDPDTRAAIRVSLVAVGLAVPLNATCGLAAAWLIARYRFRGRALLVSLIDLPLSISPVVVGVMFLLLFGRSGWFGPWLHEHQLRVVFALPGIVLATLFVTFPLVARELSPLLEASGVEEDEAAEILGATGWQRFWHVTLPNIRWGLLYGIVLAFARGLGEFGAVSVLSGKITGRTDTLPLRVEKLYNEFQTQPAFAVASVLTGLALVTLVAKKVLQWRIERIQKSSPVADRMAA